MLRLYMSDVPTKGFKNYTTLKDFISPECHVIHTNKKFIVFYAKKKTQFIHASSS